MIPVIYRREAHPYSRWRYEGLITLTNPPTVDNFQVKVTIPYQLGMNSDFSDLRFADVYGNAISYWIESKTDGSTATVWVKIPGKDSSIFFYWGNGIAESESSGDDVFEFYTDFSTGVDSEKFYTRTTGGATVTHNTDYVRLYTPVSTAIVYANIVGKTSVDTPCIMEYSLRTWDDSRQYSSRSGLRSTNSDTGTSSYPHPNIYLIIERYGGNYKLNVYDTTVNTPTVSGGVWHDITMIVDDSNTQVQIDNGILTTNTQTFSGTEFFPSFLQVRSQVSGANSYFDLSGPFWIRQYAAAEPTVTVTPTGTNRHYRRVIITDTGSGGEADTLALTTSLVLTPAEPSLFLTADVISAQTSMQLASTVGIVDRIPIAATLNLTSTFDRMRSFGDISALASESVDISKSINDTMWVLTTTIRGDSPAEFFHYSYETKDHTGTDNVIFTGFTPDTVNRHTALQNQSDVVMYDYGWYLSAQYLPDDALVINLNGSRTTWAEWIRYLLEGTGITPHRIASSAAEDKEFNFTSRTTKRDAIDAISKYCGFVFVVGWNTSTPPEPIAYWIDQEDIDDPSNGLDLPAAVTITWPDSHLVEIPSVQGTPEEKINRVRIRGSDTSGNWYSATLQTAALTSGEEIAREYYEESGAWNSQAKVDARALALYNYFTTTTHTVEATFLKRMDLRLYQKIRFQGAGFSTKLTSLGWLRIVEIHYHISGIEKYVTIKAVTDKGQLSLLLERMNYAAGGAISDIDTIVSNQISSIPMTEVGTVLSISGDIATVQTESGKIVQARVIL